MPRWSERAVLAIVVVALLGVAVSTVAMFYIQLYGSYQYCKIRHPDLPAVACMSNLEKLGNIKVEIR